MVYRPSEDKSHSSIYLHDVRIASSTSTNNASKASQSTIVDAEHQFGESESVPNNGIEGFDYSTLPPVDTGKDAWLCLLAVFTIEVMILGYGFSYGVFQDFYAVNEPFASSSSNSSVIGVLTTGILFLTTPIFLPLCRHYPQWARWMATFGVFLALISNIASSFCTKIPQLIGTQGVILGLAGGLAFCPCLVYIDQWFDKRKGLAFGIFGSGAGFGGVFIPLMLRAMLNNVGFATTMRIWAGIHAGIGLTAAYFVKPRLPPAATLTRPFWNPRALRSRFFLMNQLANTIQGAGYYLPGIYLPTYAREILGASAWPATVSLMIFNISATIGLILMGHFTDRFTSRTCILVSSLGSTIAALIVWGLTTHIATLYTFSILFGLFSGSWPAVWPAVMRETARRGEERGFGYVDTLMVYSLLCVGRGVGNIVSGPLSEALTKDMPWKGAVIGGYGSGYGALILFSGLTSLVSGINTLWYQKL
ncbi:MFS general substrate transporter [Pseudovirgaria hyperparasitica]|uniref:MFS general substrate transporter n=1 Tax=Pseudovirgaria hyperparasitica TaxID=470096 RepID=A0A6A6W1N0_9PEZI|nr:MFS general substrate transporter [Pseudovirgaria hyperparasitica]KAF2755477.1 MFS general substrate transporter [Pseudovirgaria hyperparasitica]